MSKSIEKNPYQGLRPFSYKDSRHFYGRDKSILDVLDLIASKPFSVIIGFSGSGKSSLVYAGVLRKIHKGYVSGANKGWQVAVTFPGRSPLENLYEAILNTKWLQYYISNEILTTEEIRIGFKDIKSFMFKYPIPEGERLLIFIDQFEEIFTEKNIGLNYSLSERYLEFLNEITTSSTTQYDVPLYRINVIITIRADYISKLIYFKRLPSLFSNNIYFIPAIDDEGLKSAIEEPAKRYKKIFEPDLIDLLVRKCNEIKLFKRERDHILSESEEDDTLPLLQHLLMRLWNQFQQIDVFTVDHYLMVGPLQKALDKHLNEIYYFNLNGRQRTLTEFLFSVLSKRDNDNPKRIVRNPQRIDAIACMYEQINEPKLDADELRKEFIDVVKQFFCKEVRVLKVRNREDHTTLELTSDSMIDVMHESVFRNWDLCKDWIKKEVKKEDDLQELILIKEDDPERYWKYQKIEDFLNREKYYTNTNWLKSKGFSKWKKEIEWRLNRLRKIQLQEAIMNAKAKNLIHLLKLINNEKLRLSITDLHNNRDFKREFYDALVQKDLRIKSDFDRTENKNTYWNSFVDTKVKNEYRISHYAAFAGNIDILEILDAKVFWEKQYFTDGGNSPFVLALYNNKINTAKYIYDVLKKINKESIIEEEDGENILPIQWAALNGDLALFEWLSLITDIKKSNSKGNALHYSVVYDNYIITEYLLKKGLDCNQPAEHRYTPLHIACGYSSLESVKCILEICKKNKQIEQVLSNIDAFGLTPLMRSLIPWESSNKKQRLNIINEIVRYSKYLDIDQKQQDKTYNWTVLHYAVNAQDYDVVKLILNSDPNLNIADKNGQTPIHLAANLSSLVILKILLNHLKSKFAQKIFLEIINRTDNDNSSAVMLAYRNRKFDNVFLLKENGAEFQIPFGEDYSFAEQKINKWSNDKLKKEISRSHINEYDWKNYSPLLFKKDKWITESISFALNNYEILSSIASKGIQKLIAFRYFELSFYPDAILGEIKVNGIKKFSSFFFIANSDGISILNGTSPPIHKLNVELPLQLNNENINAYLEFFCMMVHGEGGAFRIINSPSEIWWLNEDEEIETIEFVQFIINTYTRSLQMNTESNTWDTRVLINYSNALFLADFSIQKSGMIEMLNDIPIYANISASVPIFKSDILTLEEVKPENKEYKLERISFTSAAKYGLLEIMQWFKKYDLSLNIKEVTANGKTALAIAEENEHQAIIDWLNKQENIEEK